MNAPFEPAAGLVWLATHSLQAGVLVLLVLLVQWTFRRRLTSRWRFALWWIVLLRLLLPFGPESGLSLFNWVLPGVVFPHQPDDAPSAAAAYETPWPENPIPTATIDVGPLPADELDLNTVWGKRYHRSAEPPANATQPPIPPTIQIPRPPPQPQIPWIAWLVPSLVYIWLTGIVTLAAVVTVQILRFERKLSRAETTGDDSLHTLLEDCRSEFRISRTIELVETSAVQSPALFGLFRLRLLLPRGIGAQFNRAELRYIFLHELAHVKRGDLWLNWLVTALQIIHWFNPLLWLGFARLRADRELACDELALLRAGDQAGTAYGETVVKLLENLSRPAAIPGLVGILEDSRQMRRRISMIARFRRPGRWSVLAMLLMAALAVCALTDAQTTPRTKVENETNPVTSEPQPRSYSSYDHTYAQENSFDNLDKTNAGVRPDLTGRVTAKGGAPLPVPATVFIATAGPKVGTSVYCPSCYADCVKHSQTDARGAFKIESLDPALTFQILAVAKGYQPQYVSKVDPVKGKPVKIELAPVLAADAGPEHSLGGRVVDPKGNPIEGAVVEVSGIETRDGGGRWGSLPGVDPLAVTDEKGAFLITAKTPFDSMDLRVSARLFADRSFNSLDRVGPHDLVMTEGAHLRGRVLLDGRPLAGVSVGISGADRDARVYRGHFEVGTDSRGNFNFVNVPPDTDYQLYTLMDSMDHRGVVPARRIHAGADGESLDIGDLAVVPAHRIAGRVVLADGGTVPPKTRLFVGREDAWDSVQTMPGPDGSFALDGIPAEPVTLSLRIKGYHLSNQNRSLDLMNPFRLVGRADRDITNLVVLLEKGPDPRPDYRQVDPEFQLVHQRTLAGAEGATDHSQEWAVSGQVRDRKTGEPIARFQIIPGQMEESGRMSWFRLRSVPGTNGAYVTYVPRRYTEPLLQIAADGYLPATISLHTQDQTNADLELEPGSGPAGTVVTPDGKPVSGATLILLDGSLNQAAIGLGGQVSANGQGDELKTDAAGHFAFPAALGMQAVIASSRDGFGLASVQSFATNHTLILEPFGRITGTLNRKSAPGSNELLDLVFEYPAGRLPFQAHATTDSKGNFSFEQVPPGHLEIDGRLPQPEILNSWSPEFLKETDLKPGESVSVNISADDRSLSAGSAGGFRPQSPQMVISGEKLTGIVLRPDGTPAGGVDVGLQIERQPLLLGQGKLTSTFAGRQAGYIATTDENGAFTMPLFQQTLSIIAAGPDGYAQVSPEELKQSPKMVLQPWGQIQGTLRIGNRVGSNEVVSVQSADFGSRIMQLPGMAVNGGELTVTNTDNPALQPPNYAVGLMHAKTDDQGHFLITCLPPGNVNVLRRCSMGNGGWSYLPVATVAVKPGQTIVTNVGGGGRTVIGKIAANDKFTAPSGRWMVRFTTGSDTNYLATFYQLKTDEERREYYQSTGRKQLNEQRKAFHTYLTGVDSDGTFRMEDVQPGVYHLNVRATGGQSDQPKAMGSGRDLVVPPAKDGTDESPVDWGEIAVTMQ